MIETIYVYKNKTGATEPLRAVKDESGAHTYVFKVLDENDNVVSLSGAMTATFYVQRPDKVIVETPCTVSGWEVTCTPASGSYKVAGACKCFLQVLGDSVSPSTDQRFAGISLLVKGDSLGGSTGSGVTSVNGMTGDVVLNFSDIGEDGKDWIKDAGQKAIDQLMDEKRAEFDQMLKLLQNVDIADNKAAYLAFLSRAAVPSVIKLSSEDIVPIPARDLVTLKQYKQSQYNEYNMVGTPVSVTVDAEGWIGFSDDCDLLISATGYFYNQYIRDASPNILHISIGYIGENEGNYGGGTLRASYDCIAETGFNHVSIPLLHFRCKKNTKLCLRLHNDTADNDFMTNDIVRADTGSFIQFVILPDLTKFPTTQTPRVVDVTASTQDIQPGDTLPKDSLYLVIDP